jgi:hypothetical protein
MSYGEEILKLRKRVADAVSHNVFNTDNKDIIEALLIQVMNDAERNRQQCVSQAENLRKQASTLDGQAGAFASMGSIVYSVINGFVMKAEHSEREADVLKKDKEGNTTEEVVAVKKQKSKKK